MIRRPSNTEARSRNDTFIFPMDELGVSNSACTCTATLSRGEYRKHILPSPICLLFHMVSPALFTETIKSLFQTPQVQSVIISDCEITNKFANNLAHPIHTTIVWKRGHATWIGIVLNHAVQLVSIASSIPRDPRRNLFSFSFFFITPFADRCTFPCMYAYSHSIQLDAYKSATCMHSRLPTTRPFTCSTGHLLLTELNYHPIQSFSPKSAP